MSENLKSKIEEVTRNEQKPYNEVEDEIKKLCIGLGYLESAEVIKILIDTIGTYHSKQNEMILELKELKGDYIRVAKANDEKIIKIEQLRQLLVMEEIKNQEYLEIIKKLKGIK